LSRKLSREYHQSLFKITHGSPSASFLDLLINAITTNTKQLQS